MNLSRGLRYPKRLHPDIVDGAEVVGPGEELTLETARRYFGIFSVFLVPPTDLLFPSIPFRNGPRTLYGLCRKVRLSPDVSTR